MNSELDWFEFETRMRRIVTQIIQPLANSTADNTSNVENLIKKTEQHSKRIGFIEELTGSPDMKTG